ncbi:N-acetyltransferase [Sinomicrobium pectinilyticum]|uniref:N-acetyltransferase n=1 Tax=Sinomicrobium pectinilyticum TaxID=1084421 RepID=A0A3N0DYJ4_SINP1|nr:GNAT family protein [Sinomicrobium pectinilyticum]RNL80543.1 N-acetyltransferase [Sinomicrobium pectinilyticum]
MKLNKIPATYLVENPASGKVMIKNGIIKEGELKKHTRKNGIYHSRIQYRLTRKEFKQN